MSSQIDPKVWIDAANRMIAEHAADQYRAANFLKNGQRRSKKHIPYALADWVRPLQDAIAAEDEHEVKRIMMVVRAGALSLV